MKDRQIANIEASIRQRLLNLSRTRGEDFGFVLTRYANERFLYRLCQSDYADKFILKGGMLFLEFAEERDHKKQWSAFLRRLRLDTGGIEFSQVIDEIYSFLNPIISAIAADRAFSKVWLAGGPWNED